MKKISFYFLYSISACILLSCGVTKTKELVSESADKSCQLKISGSRETSMDPFKSSIIINGYGQSDTLVIEEVFASDLNTETVLFSWIGNSACTTTFLQQDNTKRVLNIKFSQDGNSLSETE